VYLFPDALLGSGDDVSLTLLGVNAEAIKAFTFAGPDRAMNQYNTKKADKAE
jgi:hypothetical protein